MKRLLGERVYETICCQRRRPESLVVITVWQVGRAAWAFARCAESEDCERLERYVVADLAAPYWKVLSS